MSIVPTYAYSPSSPNGVNPGNLSRMAAISAVWASESSIHHGADVSEMTGSEPWWNVGLQRVTRHGHGTRIKDDSTVHRDKPGNGDAYMPQQWCERHVTSPPQPRDRVHRAVSPRRRSGKRIGSSAPGRRCRCAAPRPSGTPWATPREGSNDPPGAAQENPRRRRTPTTEPTSHTSRRSSRRTDHVDVTPSVGTHPHKVEAAIIRTHANLDRFHTLPRGPRVEVFSHRLDREPSDRSSKASGDRAVLVFERSKDTISAQAQHVATVKLHS